MKTNSTVHKFLAVLLTVCLTLPATALTALADNKSGKKSYKEGIKHEESQQWDLAAQEFALAVAADPKNAEYKLHYTRALQNASLMFTKRGDELAKQGDYASAYNAYRQALGYDPGNEMASLKMRSMLELQKEQALGLGQYKYNEKTGNLKPISNEVTVATKPRSRDLAQDIIFKDIEFKDCIKNVARNLDLNVLFDESVRVQGKIAVELRGVTMAKAFDLILLQNKMTFEQVDRKTILIYADNTQTNPTFEKAVVKTFYLGNIKTSDARNVINSLIPGRPVGAIDDQKMLILKGTPAELQLVQDILESVDKNISEVVIDVEIYEVSNDAKVQIGNQISVEGQAVTNTVTTGTGTNATTTTTTVGRTGGLNDLGGLGRRVISGHDFTKAGNPAIVDIVGDIGKVGKFFSPFAGVGGLIGLPTTSLSLLQSKGHSRLLNKMQIHALDGQQNQTKVGRSVPVSLGQNFGAGIVNQGGFGTGNVNQGGGVINPIAGGGFNNGFGGGGGLFNNIQYKDVGLVIDVTPKITNEGYVELKMKIETSDVQAGADPLTPNFTQRSLSTTARIQDGVTSIVASVTQDSKGDSRTTVPVLGMLPLVGRLFTTPNQDMRQTDIIITVTPRIIRSTEITKEDNLARMAGSLTNAGGAGSGLTPSIDDVLFRVQQEEEQERRLVAQERGLPVDPAANASLAQTPAQIAPGSAPNTVPAVRAASNPLPDNGLPAGPSGTANTFQEVGNSNGKPARKTTVFQGDPNSSSNQYNTPPPQPEQTIQADVTTPPPVEPNPVQPDPALLNNGANPTLPGGGVNPNMVNPTLPGGGMNPGGAARPIGPNGQPMPEGAKPPDISENPQPEVKPAQVMAAVPPPHVQKYLQEQRLKALKEQEEAKKAAKNAKSQPTASAPPLVETAPIGPRGNAPRATLKPGALDNAGAPTPMRIEAPAAGTLALSLNPAQSRVGVNKTVLVTMQVDAQSLLASANLALRFDPAKLQVKSVREGDVLGKQADVTHTAKDGLLTITANAANGKAAKASGRLLVIEFTALREGPVEIAFDGAATQIKLPGDTLATVNLTPAQFVVIK